MHPRGHKGELDSLSWEWPLDGVILAATAEPGRLAWMSFTDPEVIIGVEIVEDRAGLPLWTRGARARFPFLGID